MKNYQLSIKLLEIEPPIWRRLAVPGTVSLAKLHAILQKVMGWENHHIYLFTAGRQQYGEGVSEWNDFAQRVVNAKRVMLQTSLCAKVRASSIRTTWETDGNTKYGWKKSTMGHPSRSAALKERAVAPRRIVVGHTVMRNYWKFVFDPEHPEYQERRDWLGEGFDPEQFNVEIVNRRLKRLKVGREAA